jgi:uncharacterized membrane protein
MKLYEFCCLILPFIIANFCMDYLSDSEIIKDELKIGIIQFIHHTILIIHGMGILIPFLNPTLIIVILGTLVNIGVQIGWLVHNDYCWLTILTNRLIGTNEKNRKWMADIQSHIKHYIYGDIWATSKINGINNTNWVFLLNIINLIIIYKYRPYVIC